MEASRFVRAVLPARVPQSTKLLAACIVVVGAGVAMAITFTHTCAARSPVHHWALDGDTTDTQGFASLNSLLTTTTPLDLGSRFTLSARVNWSQHVLERDAFLSNDQIVLRKRDDHFAAVVGGQVLSSGIPIRYGTWMRIVVTRDGDELTLWVDGNPSRMAIRDDAKAGFFYIDGNVNIADVTVWDRALSDEEVLAIR